MFNRIRPAALAAYALVFAFAASGQSIFTYAGGGTTDNRPATSLPLRGIGGIAVDSKGTVYFSEPDRNVVHRLDVANGTLTLYAGDGQGSFGGDGGPATRAALKYPLGLALDPEGNLFIADRDNNRVRKVDAKTRIITTVAGNGEYSEVNGDNGPATKAWVNRPAGLAWHDGRLYLAQDAYNEYRVRRIAPDQIITTIAGTGPEGFSGDGGPATAAQLNGPKGLAVDGARNVYIADALNGRVRRINAATGTIETVVGGGTPADGIGDGGQGTAAGLEFPLDVALDPSGRLLIADTGHSRVRRYDPGTKVVTTVAGNGVDYGGGDGKPAVEAGIYRPFALAVDRSGTLYVHDGSTQTLRRVDASTQIISTVAGGGTFIGDGLIATSALLSTPRGLAIDAAGNLLISDPGHTLVRKVDAKTRIISTFAGQLGQFYGGDEGVDVKDSIVGGVSDLAVNAAGEIFILAPHHGKIFKVDRQGKFTTYAGGGSPADFLGDNGPATSAQISPAGIAVDAAGNLYIVDKQKYPDAGQPQRHRVRKVDAATKVISTIAGGATAGFAGDGGPATAALFDDPEDITVDGSGNLFVSDLGNGAIRRIDGATGTITTYAGRGNASDNYGDGLPATQAVVWARALVADRRNGDLYLADNNGHNIRKIDGRTRVITTVAGSGKSETPPDFAGDNGKATEARLNLQYERSGLALDAAGNLFIADTVNDRVRVVYACASVTAPQLAAPNDGATGVSAPTLSWTAGAGTFRHDVYLDTAADPQTIVAANIDATTFTPSNLLPNTKYYWKVRGKGDPFCDPVSTAASPVRSFTTGGRCGVGAFDLVSPADGATGVSSTSTLSWQAAAGAGSYDVYFGNVNPPPLFTTTTGTSVQVTARSGVHYWTVVAHAACDPAQTASSPTRSFTPTPPVSCGAPATVTLLSPDNNATGVATSATLTWRADGCAAAPFDVYLGTTNPPPLYATNVSSPSQVVNGLEPNTTYRWQIVARDVNGGTAASPVRTFTTRACATPDQPTITFAPVSVGSGSTYTIVWSPAPGLDPDGGYLVERSNSASFATVDSQVTLSTAASFIAGRAGIWYHRVRAIPSCDPSRTGPPSDVKQVTVTAARPNVVFTVQPAAAVISVGDSLEDIRGTFTLENIGDSPAIVAVGRTELGNSPPFFSIVDPLGNDVFVTLEPRKPRTFGIRYSGPRTDVRGSYQGVIQVAGAGLAVIPYAFVELRVGDGGSSQPRFVVDGAPADYLALPGRAGTSDTAVTIGVRNEGTSAMEMAAEIGPEVWIVPERGWNDGRVEPGATRTFSLTTRRLFAPQGSPLPRYTYITVRTKDGGSARLLVQDNDEVRATTGRTRILGAGEQSLVVPEVTSSSGANGALTASRVRLTNAGSESVQAELIFTPPQTDGFDSVKVRRAVVVVPPNDVVTLVDPLVQIFKLPRPASGQLEVRLPAERVGLLGVTASTQASDGRSAIVIPAVTRGSGARLQAPHVVYGVTQNAATTTSLVLAETSGLASADVRATLYDAAGASRGQGRYSLARYGYLRVDDVVSALGGSTADYGKVVISVESGAGSVLAVGVVRDRATGTAATFVSEAEDQAVTNSARLLRAWTRGGNEPLDTLPSVTIVVPVLASPTSAGATPAYRTLLSFSASSASAAQFKAVLKSPAGTQIAETQPFTVGVGASVIVRDATKDLFGAVTAGTILVEGSGGGKVSAVLQTVSGATVTPAATIPLVTNASEFLSSATLLQRPLFYDGLEQSTDPTRGSRWLLNVNEVGGGTGTVKVRLYEAGNRTSPIAEKEFSINAYQQLTLDTVFGALGLDAPDRRKDRTNVQVAVIGATGAARVAASAVSIDNRTGDTKVFALVPTVGSSNPSHSLVSVVTPPPAPQNPKRRTVRH